MTQPTSQPEPGGDAAGAAGEPLLARRLAALAIDWGLCLLIALGFGMQWGQASGFDSFLPLLVLFVEYTVLVATLGSTVGQRVLGLRVVALPRHRTLPDRPGHPRPLQAGLRAALLCLAIPALIMDPAGRGLHDRAAGTQVVRADGR